MSDLGQPMGRQRLIGIEFASNWRDLATGKISVDDLVALLTETKLYRSDVKRSMNDFYNMMALTRESGKPDIKDLHTDHVMALSNKNKIIRLPHKLNLEAYAKNNPDMPSWIDLDTGLSFRIDDQGQKRIFDSQIIKGFTGNLENMVHIQHELAGIKFDLSDTKRKPLKKSMSDEIKKMNSRFNPFHV